MRSEPIPFPEMVATVHEALREQKRRGRGTVPVEDVTAATRLTPIQVWHALCTLAVRGVVECKPDYTSPRTVTILEDAAPP